MQTIKIEQIKLENKKRISLTFPFDKELQIIVRTLPDARWSAALKAWHITSSLENENKIMDIFKDKAHVVKGLVPFDYGPVKIALSDEILEKVQKYKYWMLSRRYSESTVGVYTDAIKIFLRFTPTRL